VFDARGFMENANPPPPLNPLPPAPAPGPSSNQRTWDMLCHMSALAGLLFPAFGALLAPLIVWQLKRNEFPSVDEHGKEAFNFQLSMFIYYLACTIAAFVGMIICIGPVFGVLAVVLHYGAIILGVVAGIKASDGVMYRYPFNLRLIR
jgi:uncharacterized protein